MNRFRKDANKEMGGIDFRVRDAEELINMFLPNVQRLHRERQAQF